ncbi:TPA: hypothetical protein HA235_03945 [Candidatus Woesearchaeota archaeon]|nr:hypothetical protein [uncultured archaeon]MBS3173329.1 hypothetical protein [Candidatus Woesearchaeota archaeon]HIH31835.1 hypothetical protein [Candidatus Woesearchaeota archaeon]HIH55452.1 hypothetical protein [Candidatus Woesearchaeota archaeon]HIJ01908.1 hypothetical protein [Candidatus Woesearchaeota archaeon]
MSNQKNENTSPEDKCDNCGETNAETFWDYEDGSVLCEKCCKKIGDEWNERIKADSEDEEELPSKTEHKKSESNNTSEKHANMGKYVIGGAVFIIALILVFSARTILAGGTSNGVDYSTNQVAAGNLAGTGNAAARSGSVQNAKLALVDFSYKLTPNKLTVGVPARIEVDASTLSGCMKNIVIRDFNVRKTITSSDNIIEFTPDKTGIFWITCGMGMGAGSFEVVNADGTRDTSAQAQTQATPPKPTGGNCGAGGGGCGCGGG